LPAVSEKKIDPVPRARRPLRFSDPTGLRVRLGELENPGFHYGAFSAHPSSYQG